METRNQADALIFLSEKRMEDGDPSAAASERKAVETAISSLKDALGGSTVADIRRKTEELDDATRKLGDVLKSSSPSSRDDDGIIDAEFEDTGSGKP